MTYNSEKNHRKSIRLKGYDYAQNGAYFVTLVTQGRATIFGEVVDGVMVLNDAGKMVEMLWQKIPETHPHIGIDACSIMPNHFHGILVIDNVGTRFIASGNSDNSGEGAMNRRPYGGFMGVNNPMIKNNSLGAIIRWFKGKTTYEIRKISA